MKHEKDSPIDRDGEMATTIIEEPIYDPDDKPSSHPFPIPEIKSGGVGKL